VFTEDICDLLRLMPCVVKVEARLQVRSERSVAPRFGD
jgi:hypothetical protein